MLFLLLFSLARQLHLLFHSPKSPTGCLWLLLWHKCLLFSQSYGFCQKKRRIRKGKTQGDPSVLQHLTRKSVGFCKSLEQFQIHTNLPSPRSYLLASWKWHVISWCFKYAEALENGQNLPVRRQFKENSATLIAHLIAHLICALQIYRKWLFSFLLKALV